MRRKLGMTSILIVDDEPSIRQIISTLLTLEGYAVTTASDGRAALTQILAAPPDVVISDVRMPHMSGCELLTAIRAHPTLDAIRFILLTSFVDESPETVTAAASADACISKPFTRQVMLNTLRTLIV